MITDLTFQFARSEDIEGIRHLLKTAGLPFEDVQTGSGHFMIAKQNNQIAGCVGLQICGEDGLFRSLVVSKAERSFGLGKALTKEMLEYASRLKLRNVYLLTTTAENFFTKFGFIKMNRENAPVEISKTTEFSSLCPSTAVLMTLNLGG